MDKFVNLHSHTMHSHVDAIVRIPELFERVVSLKQKAVAITDHGVMAGIYEAYKEYKKIKEKGIDFKFIPGNEIYFVEDLEDKKAKRRHLVLLAQNEVGYRNLLKITAEGFRNAVTVMNKQFPRVTEEILRENKEGIIATSACGGSLIAASIFQGDRDKAKTAASLFRDIFGDKFFIEVQPHSLTRGDFNQKELNAQLISIAKELDIEMVATCDSHYLTPKHEKYHDMVIAIGSKKPLDDPNRHRYATYNPCMVCNGAKVYPEGSEEPCYACMGTGFGSIEACPEFYVKSGEQVKNFFVADYGEEFAQSLIDTSCKIGEMCEPPDYMEPKGHRLPVFPWEDEEDADEFKEWVKGKKSLSSLPMDASYLRFKALNGFKEYCKDFSNEDKKTYWERIVKELTILEARDFSSYMLIVSDFMSFARKNKIRTSPARGSGASSLVGFLIGIHTVDPMKYGLIFERFQSKKRPTPPDYDIDFAPSGREKVIDYCKSKYGNDKLSFVSNIVKLTPKVVIKDVCRSLKLGGDKSTAFGIANRVTGTIPDTVKEGDKVIKVDTYEKALKYSKDLREFNMLYPEVEDYATHLINLPRAFGVHAAAVLISDVPLDRYLPLRADKEGHMVSQYDKDVCEENGFVKFDFLGLDTLDIMDEAYELAKTVDISVPDPDEIPEGDEKTYRLIQSGHNVGVFQLAGSLSPICKALKPKNIKDIAHVNALGRPSCTPAERKSFVECRFGKAKPTYPNKVLKPVLEHTYGVCVYDEDLLKLAQHVAGWDLSEADVLRKVTKMKEKGAKLAEQIEVKFIEDAMRHSKISYEEASYIWEKVILPFAKYAFNLSHAVSYSILSYRTAYYKVHATAPFLCAQLNSETRGNRKDRAEKIDILKRECKKFKKSIDPCDVNISKQYYTLKDKNTIVTGLGAIKGIGDKALNTIIDLQPYYSFEDFLYRTPSARINKSIVISLAKAGAFDSFGISRKFAIEHYANIRKELLQHKKKMLKALDDDYFLDNEATTPTPRFYDEFNYSGNDFRNEEYTLKEKMILEKEVLGEYLSGTVDNLFPGFFKGGAYGRPLSSAKQLSHGTKVRCEAIINSIREFKIKKAGRNQGRIFARVLVEDLKGDHAEIIFWPNQYKDYGKYLKEGVPLRGIFEINENSGDKSLTIAAIEDIYRGEESEV